MRKKQKSYMKQREMQLKKASDVLDAMAIYLASKYGDNGVLRIPRPDMGLLKNNILTTTADRDSIIIKTIPKENINGRE